MKDLASIVEQSGFVVARVRLEEPTVKLSQKGFEELIRFVFTARTPSTRIPSDTLLDDVREVLYEAYKTNSAAKKALNKLADHLKVDENGRQ
jgi:hypothetical protein